MESVDTVPPLAVYHICRICVRPRSARYHREHPIPIDGLPPPPGICRRCRIASVDGSKTIAEVVEFHESGEVKLGVKCLVPESDYTSSDVIRAKATERFVRESEYTELKSVSERDVDIIYRPARASAPQERAAEVLYRPIQVMVPPPPPSDVAVTSKKQTNVTMASNAATLGQNSPFRLESPEVTPLVPARVTSPTCPKKAGSVREVTKSSRSSQSRRRHHHTSIVIEAQKPERTESEIRRLARDEVVRYRQAERMLEAHGDAYAHGRLVPAKQPSEDSTPLARVPVERRIALEKDVVEKPWVKSPECPRHLERVSRRYRERSYPQRELLEDAAVGKDSNTVPSDPVTISSSASSDKTRWPDTSELRRRKATKQHDKVKAVEEQDPRNEELAPKKCHKSAAERGAKLASTMFKAYDIHQPKDNLEADVASTCSSTWTDREYWLDGEPARTSLGRSLKTANVHLDRPSSSSQAQRPVIQRQQLDTYVDERERAPGDSPRHRQYRIAKSAETKAPPYPAEESIVSAQMPSPKVSASKTKVGQSNDQDSEYIYVERTVQAARSSSKEPYYHAQEIFGQRRKLPQDQPLSKKTTEQSLRREHSKHHISDVSSRVRFAKQVEFSPTPPGSDASSSRFRDIGRTRAPEDRKETGEHLIAEYERRGRSRSCLPYEGYDYRWQRKSGTAQQPGQSSAIEVDRDRTARPAQRITHRSGSSELSALLVNNRPLARAKSESPSREKLYETTKKQKEDGFGPYRTEENKDGSLLVEDGRSMTSKATSSSGSSSSGYRYVRRETVQRGPR